MEKENEAVEGKEKGTSRPLPWLRSRLPVLFPIRWLVRGNDAAESSALFLLAAARKQLSM